MGLVELGDFTVKKAIQAGLSEEEGKSIFVSAFRRLPGNLPRELWEKQILTWITNRAQKVARNVSVKQNLVQSIREYIEKIVNAQAEYISRGEPIPEKLLIPGEIIISPKNMENIKLLMQQNLVDFCGAGETGDEIQIYWKKTNELPELELRITKRLDEKYVLTYIKEGEWNKKPEFVWDQNTEDGKRGTIIISRQEEALDK